MRHLSIQISTDAVSCDATVRSKGETFVHLARLAADCYGLDENVIAAGLSEREALGSTGFGASVAIPHAKIIGLEQCVGLFLRLAEPIGFGAHDGKPVDLVFGLLSPEQGGADHLKALAEISRFLRDDSMVAKLRGASGKDALYVLLTGQREQRAA